MLRKKQNHVFFQHVYRARTTIGREPCSPFGQKNCRGKIFRKRYASCVCVCVCVCSKNCADHGKAGTIQIQKYHSMGYSLPHPSHIPSGDSQESRGRKMRFSARSRRLCRRVRLSPDMVARGASSRLTAQIILPPCSCPYSTKRPGRPPRSGAGIRQ